jgi:hypothetical protein
MEAPISAAVKSDAKAFGVWRSAFVLVLVLVLVLEKWRCWMASFGGMRRF